MGAGDNAVWEDIAELVDPVVCFLVQAAVQSIPDNVATALTFATGSTIVDTHTSHSESVNTTRITPPKPGVYEFGGEYVTQGMTTPASRSAHVRKNGATALAPGARDAGTTITSSPGGVLTITEMNGSSDYCEFMATQDSAGATNTSASAQLSSTFYCKYLRPL